MAKQYQVCDMLPRAGIDGALGHEFLRVGKDTAWNAKVAGTLDLTRERLDFEIGRGGKVMELDKKSYSTSHKKHFQRAWSGRSK